ncbi:uracil-DNA glycosylase family protein [Massilia sp. GCM10020059]|uniref:Uracil-DNA glycosylase n=1 Tax=Massilia agrisoli TaxID=2892444 RepID=A0ABS8IYU1_9BURK|nr:uracil-DNA glycosylase [Massilia agrisoli]MCC6072987.1 uracil-DNA glycosylase [Massilia agrisoli]
MSGRTAAFLEEIGIGPLWTLRQSAGEAAPEVQAEEAQAPVQEAAPAPRPYRPEPSPALPPPPVYQPGHEPRAPMNHPQPPGSAWADDDVPAAVTDEEIALMDWAQLRAAIASCTRCGLCAGGRKPVYGSGARQAQWVVAAGATTAADEKEGQPIAGDAGKLLVNMLAAVELSRDTNAYVTNLIKCRPTSVNGGDRAPTADEARACRPYLEREVALTGAGMVLTMGQIAANGLLGKPLAEPLSASRGMVHALGEAPLVATLHPGELLRRGADKALAWADLCLAKAHDGRAG